MCGTQNGAAKACNDAEGPRVGLLVIGVWGYSGKWISTPMVEAGVGVKSNVNEEGTESTLKGTWDWERESKIREVCEEMERWAIKAQLRRDPLLIAMTNLLTIGALKRGKQLTVKCALQRGKRLLG
ncbi:hypothetical protein Godav_003618 [Gossypium davidsonii]|uniref:Uncharacterized protein n=2 Tax=Gossypium TaxID=3633 RepID=A0A7J8SIH0_GOSDV|nr:hypothetical protein [Gossypium davidsonii]MBA0661451.1 hypothetical protein [Gossypium klotzschianum]